MQYLSNAPHYEITQLQQDGQIDTKTFKTKRFLRHECFWFVSKDLPAILNIDIGPRSIYKDQHMANMISISHHIICALMIMSFHHITVWTTPRPPS